MTRLHSGYNSAGARWYVAACAWQRRRWMADYGGLTPPGSTIRVPKGATQVAIAGPAGATRRAGAGQRSVGEGQPQTAPSQVPPQSSLPLSTLGYPPSSSRRAALGGVACRQAGADVAGPGARPPARPKSTVWGDLGSWTVAVTHWHWASSRRATADDCWNSHSCCGSGGGGGGGGALALLWRGPL
jgi:hypothetical protein